MQQSWQASTCAWLARTHTTVRAMHVTRVHAFQRKHHAGCVTAMRVLCQLWAAGRRGSALFVLPLPARPGPLQCSAQDVCWFGCMRGGMQPATHAALPHACNPGRVHAADHSFIFQSDDDGYTRFLRHAPRAYVRFVTTHHHHAHTTTTTHDPLCHLARNMPHAGCLIFLLVCHLLCLCRNTPYIAQSSSLPAAPAGLSMLQAWPRCRARSRQSRSSTPSRRRTYTDRCVGLMCALP